MPAHSLKVDEAHHGLRLDIFLSKNLPDTPSRSFVQTLIKSQAVTVNGKVVKSHHQVSTGDGIEVSAAVAPKTDIEPENIPLDIFYEDECLLIVNKPCGMTVHPASGQYTQTLVNALLYHCESLSDMNTDVRPGIVHRLDKETSGLILIAKNNKTHAFLAEQFEQHTIRKQYIAIVEGVVEFDEGFIDAPLGRHPRHREKRAVVYAQSKEAQTLYRVKKRKKDKTLIALFPQTGRTHQLRVHMAHLGHPILGDEKYGKKSSFFRLALHAQAIGFIHPQRLKYLEVSSRTPNEFLDAF